jgi:hypothetical protein
MKCKFSTTAAIFAVLVAWLVGAPAARAGVLWTAQWQNEKPTIVSDRGDNELSLSVGPAANGNGAATIAAANITVQAPFVGTSDSFTKQNYALNLVLTDSASHMSRTLLFSGAVDGTVTPTNSQITNAFHPGHSAYDFILGGNHYDVTMAYQADGAGAHVGSLSATIVNVPEVGSQPTQPPAVAAPEPSTMVLATVGITCGAWSLWRRRCRA